MRRMGLAGQIAVVVVVAALAGLAALVFSKSQSTQFSSSAQLYYGSSQELQVLGTGYIPNATDTTTQMANQQALVTSYDIATATATATPGLHLSADQIHSDVTATIVAGTQLLQLTATGASPAAAQQLLTSYLSSYRHLVAGREQQQATSGVRALRAEFAGLSKPARAGVAGSTLRAQIGALELLRRVGSGIPSVAQLPRASTGPSQPRTSRNVLFGVIFGLILGAGLIALRSSAGLRFGQSPAPEDPGGAAWSSSSTGETAPHPAGAEPGVGGERAVGAERVKQETPIR